MTERLSMGLSVWLTRSQTGISVERNLTFIWSVRMSDYSDSFIHSNQSIIRLFTSPLPFRRAFERLNLREHSTPSITVFSILYFPRLKSKANILTMKIGWFATTLVMWCYSIDLFYWMKHHSDQPFVVSPWDMTCPFCERGTSTFESIFPNLWWNKWEPPSLYILYSPRVDHDGKHDPMSSYV